MIAKEHSEKSWSGIFNMECAHSQGYENYNEPEEEGSGCQIQDHSVTENRHGNLVLKYATNWAVQEEI